MSDRLTRNGALEITSTLDRIASVVQEHNEILGIDLKIATDFAHRCDLISDAVETTAVQNFPQHTAAAQFDAEVIAEEVPGPLEQIQPSQPFMSDHFTQERFEKLTEVQEAGKLGIKPCVTKEGAEELSSAIDRIASVVQDNFDLLGIDTKVAADFAYRCDLISDAVEKTAGMHFNPATIAEEVPGPLEQIQAHEPFMNDHFTQEKFEELDAAQTSGKIGIPSYVTDTFKAASDVESARTAASLVTAMESLLKFAAPDPEQELTELPGFSPMQIKQEIDRLNSVHVELEIVQKQFADALAKIGKLEKEEAAGLAALKKAAGELKLKGNFILKAKNSLLSFSTKFQPKTPGLEQLMAHPDDVKAGDLVGRITEKLGVEVAAAVAAIIAEAKTDLTHTTLAISALKVVAKSSSVPESIAKQAGLSDIVVSVKTWLSGKMDSIAQKLLGFAGDVAKWAKGFTERTHIVENQTKHLLDLLGNAEKSLHQMSKAGSSIIEAKFAEGDTAGFEKWMKTQPEAVQKDWADNKEKYGDQFKTANIVSHGFNLTK